jgi:protocatechuate 3,4-dioxygenase beta subunit
VSTKPAVGQQYLRGTQFTDTAGNVQFRTIFPSWYGGRTPHVHFKVFLSGNEVVASQIFFPDEISKEVFADWRPYREHASKRTTFNDNDPIRQGVHSSVARQPGSYGRPPRRRPALMELVGDRREPTVCESPRLCQRCGTAGEATASAR